MTTQVEKTYKLISAGSLKNGFTFESANANICKTLKIDTNKASQILKSGTVIKSGINKASALKFQNLFEQLGLEVTFTLIEQPKPEKTNKPSHDQAYFEKLLSEPFTKIKTSLGYKLGLIAVLSLSLIAPLLYFSFIIGLVYGAYAYGVFYGDVIAVESNIKAKVIALVIPYFIMSILFIFLVRPLFIGYKRPSYYVLKKNQFPGLFHLVEVMCKKIGVPIPKEITVDNEVNAHAGPINGLSDLVKGNLRLNVGLPLLAGMKINQFIGVLAHEFGHFAQPTAMFANIMINKVNNWLADRAYNPDPLQEKLKQWKDENDDNFFYSYAIFGIMLLNGCIYSIRLLFKGLFHANYFLTQFMSRKMEYDADCYESVFAGSSEFERTSKQLRKLSYGAAQTHYLNQNAWNDNQLLNNVSGAISDVTEKLSSSIDERIQEDMQSLKFDAWATHPADNDRIEYIAKRNDIGIVKEDFAAINICPNFEELSQSVTHYMYFKSFGNDQYKQYLKNNNDILASDEKKQEQNKSIDIYYNSNYTNRLFDLNLSDDPDIKALTLDECITKIRREMMSFQELDKQVGATISKLTFQKLGLVFAQQNIDIDADDFDLNSNTPLNIQSEIQTTFKTLNDTQNKRSLKDHLFRQRIELDKQFMSDDIKNEVNENLSVLKQITQFRDDFLQLDVNCDVFNRLHNQDEEIYYGVKSSIDEYQNKIFDVAISVLNKSETIIFNNHDQKNLKEFLETWVGSTHLIRDQMDSNDTFELARKVVDGIRHHFYWRYCAVIEQCLKAELDNDVKQLKLI